MRLDKFLKVSRLIKRRTVANEAADTGCCSINGKQAKPSAEVKVGDIIEIRFGNNVTTVEVLSLVQSVRKEGAAEMYAIVNP
ncbi:MAG: RNA-binding S4 domain-containing protein [Defluviitaleaceae bacterium]|nr:RNA-binding S4 domain-containing protein [Defluviitaleaceae bacterium]